MPKLQYEQCMGCGSFVPMVLDTTGLYVSRCWWCGCAMTQVHGIFRRLATVSQKRPFAVTANTLAPETAGR